MYGIDVSGGLAVLATAGPQPARVVGTAASLEDLGHMAPGLAGPTAAAAAAYANDVERQALRDAVIAAGFERVCLINRPTAALWAYRELAGLDGSNFVVVECGPGRTEITLARSD
jgi:2-methylcitrate dehydratase PrpD